MNPDLAKERDGASFNSETLTYILDGGVEKTRRRRFIQNLAAKDAERDGGKDLAYLSVEERYDEGLRKDTKTINRLKELNITDEGEQNIYRGVFLGPGSAGLALHHLAFVPPIMTQASDEQKQKWLPLLKSYKMIGGYAQTELGHGSNLRKLETTATFDPRSDEIVLHSPKVTSMKWWPGNIGKTGNHALVMARLFSRGQDCGLQAFVAQTRDLETHAPLPGVELGDIGPTWGGDLDNGFMKFTHFRIPRSNMLMKFAKLDAAGTFTKAPNDRVLYAGMMSLRAILVSASSRSLATAVTIATRYSCVRHQSELKPGAPEPQVIAFQTQQHKLFPQLATAYAYWFTGILVSKVCSDVMKGIAVNKYERLPECHCLTAALKGYTTYHAAEGVEILRLACGGHGYSRASNLPQIYQETVGAVTAEGEHTILMLQAARFLVKAYAQAQAGQKLTETVEYLGREGAKFTDGKLTNEKLVSLFEMRAQLAVRTAGERMQKLLQSTDQAGAWAGSTVPLVRAAWAHAELLVVRFFCQFVRNTSTELQPVLQKVCFIYALHLVGKQAGEFLLSEGVTSEQLFKLQELQLDLYGQLRPDAVALVDAFDFPDGLLRSALGRFDGNVYPALYDWAQKSPLNKTEVHESFQKYIRPMQQKAKL